MFEPSNPLDEQILVVQSSYAIRENRWTDA